MGGESGGAAKAALPRPMERLGPFRAEDSPFRPDGRTASSPVLPQMSTPGGERTENPSES